MKPEAIDAILATNPRYAGATEGEWDNNFDPRDDEQTEVVVGVPHNGWSMYAAVAEMAMHDANQREIADVHVVMDAKLNAAKAIVAERLVTALREMYEAGCGKSKDVDRALTAWRELTD